MAKRRARDSMILWAIWRSESPKAGDLVLLRRLDLSNQKGRKLEPRWEGPYLLDKVSYHGQSGTLKSLHEEEHVGRYHLNDTKILVTREEKDGGSTELWKTMAKAAEDDRKELERILKEQEEVDTATPQGMNPEASPDPDWWDEFISYPDDTAEEQEPPISTKAKSNRHYFEVRRHYDESNLVVQALQFDGSQTRAMLNPGDAPEVTKNAHT